MTGSQGIRWRGVTASTEMSARGQAGLKLDVSYPHQRGQQSRGHRAAPGERQARRGWWPGCSSAPSCSRVAIGKLRTLYYERDGLRHQRACMGMWGSSAVVRRRGARGPALALIQGNAGRSIDPRDMGLEGAHLEVELLPCGWLRESRRASPTWPSRRSGRGPALPGPRREQRLRLDHAYRLRATPPASSAPDETLWQASWPPERPERVEVVRAVLERTRWAEDVIGPQAYPLALAERVHEAAYLVHLRERCAEGAFSAGPADEWFPRLAPETGMDTGTPLHRARRWTWPPGRLRRPDWGRPPAGGRARRLCPVRPPGHPRGRRPGGYCYFQQRCPGGADRLLATPQPGQGGSVAVLDLDIHHGNGTQDIFYATDRVLYSQHPREMEGYLPHTGFVEETGCGSGQGFTFNQPFRKGQWPAYAGARPGIGAHRPLRSRCRPLAGLRHL